MTTQTEALKLARQLLWRYRHETPIGRQPHMICQEVDEAFERIDEALAKPEQEPVAWFTATPIEGNGNRVYYEQVSKQYNGTPDTIPLYTTPPQK